MEKEKNQVYTPHAIRYMDDGDIDRILLGFLPMKLTEIYERCGVGRSRNRTIKNKVRKRLNALKDRGLISTKGKTYYKKDEHQEAA